LIGGNFALGGLKILVGWLGQSYALIADGLESFADVITSIMVLAGLEYSAKPADAKHPFGHGRAESVAALAASALLIGTAVVIAVQSLREIAHPHLPPAWYTLPVLLLIVFVKEVFFRLVVRKSKEVGSLAMHADAWHHRSDALTSLAAFIGISVALLGGPGFESADDWAALCACSLIFLNGFKTFQLALDELMDVSVPSDLETELRALAGTVRGVKALEKSRVRKSGPWYFIELHVLVDESLTVRDGHDIAHAVKEELLHSGRPVHDVIVHIEPFDPTRTDGSQVKS
jgi:cation diffusion facilitator family transporter